MEFFLLFLPCLSGYHLYFLMLNVHYLTMSKTIMYLNNMKSSNLSFGVWNLDIISAKITHE